MELFQLMVTKYKVEANKNLKIVDLTGAGDLFASGYLHGYVNNKTTRESLEKELKCLQK